VFIGVVKANIDYSKALNGMWKPNARLSDDRDVGFVENYAPWNNLTGN